MRTPAIGNSPLDVLRRRYNLTPAPAMLLCALLRVPGGRATRRETLAQHFGRAHRASNVAPHLVTLRKRLGHDAIRTRDGLVTLSPEIRQELRGLYNERDVS